MIIKDIEFKLKDGRTAILRSANEKDAKALIEYMKKSTSETDFLLRTPEECENKTIEQEIDFINSCNLSDTHTLLVCEADGKLPEIAWSGGINVRKPDTGQMWQSVC